MSEARSTSLPHIAGPSADDAPGGLSVGAVAARLGVAPDTVRSWGRRYGLSPSARTAGGHRRFAAEDVDRLTRMQQLVAGGATPAAAARQVLTGHAPARSGTPGHPAQQENTTRGGPGGRVLAVRGASLQARGLARAASRMDADAMQRVLHRLLAERGAIAVWNEVMRPVLLAAGERWMASGDGIEIEHLLSESVLTACLRYRWAQQPAHPGRPVLLASFPGDLHVLPLHVLDAALAEHRIPTRQLGGRVPVDALIAASRRTGASAVFVWRQIAGHGAAPTITLPPSRPPVRLVVGGPGWAGARLEPGTVVAADLQQAVDLLRDAAAG